eukprot:6475031-Amphidinium_carterae.1
MGTPDCLLWVAFRPGERRPSLSRAIALACVVMMCPFCAWSTTDRDKDTDDNSTMVASMAQGHEHLRYLASEQI